MHYLIPLQYFHIQVVDPPVDDETGAASQGAFRLSVGEEIAVDCDRLWSALAETSRATTSIFSRLVRLVDRQGDQQYARGKIAK